MADREGAEVRGEVDSESSPYGDLRKFGGAMSGFNITNDTMVVTSSYVTEQRLPIVLVSHEDDEEGGSLWQFHCGNGDYSLERMQLVRLDTILAIDPSVAEVGDIEMGHSAKRRRIGKAWKRS